MQIVMAPYCIVGHQKSREDVQKQHSFSDPEGMIQTASTTPANFRTRRRPRLSTSPHENYVSASPHENFDSASQIGVHPVSLRRVGSIISRGRNRSTGIRHEPYTTVRNTSLSSDEQRPFTNPDQTEISVPLKLLESVDKSNSLSLNKNIKIEASGELDVSGTDELPQKSPSGQVETSEYSSDSEFTKSHNVDSVISNATGIPSEQFKSEPNATSNSVAVAATGILPALAPEKDANVTVKVEPVTEDEMDLEIIGVEPGQLSQNIQAWVPQAGNQSGAEETEAVGNQLGQNDGKLIIHFVDILPVFGH